MKPICVKCHRFLRPVKTGLYFLEGMPVGTSRPKPGLEAPDEWKPYKLWSGDKWECLGCGFELVSGVGLQPISENYKPDFADDVRAFNATFQVNDC